MPVDCLLGLPSLLFEHSASDEGADVDVVWQDKISITWNKYDRGSIVVFRSGTSDYLSSKAV